MYDVNSKCADDFINHEEILETLAYADENKNNKELIESLIKKASLRKGLSHKEASVLLACQDDELNEKIFRLAEQIKKDFYGNRIVLVCTAIFIQLLYQRLYLLSVPYEKQTHCQKAADAGRNSQKKLLHCRIWDTNVLALEAGEDPVHNPIEYYLESIKTIYSIKHKNGAIRRVNVNIAATTVENYRKLKEAGIGTYILFPGDLSQRKL